MSEKKIVIKVNDIEKHFDIPKDKNNNLKGKLLGFFRKARGYTRYRALRGVSFDVHEGDFFGIVGRNGSGKSTLLKIIAGIYTPSKGYVKVNGRLVPFIELGVGFNPELTGRENVYLSGALLGFSRKEIDVMYNDIVDFAELGAFMGERLRNYSSGMQVRLAFSVAIRAKGDILLLDEVLAVGDSAFQQKCYDYFEQLKREGRTVVLVSHNMGAVERFCNKAVLIEKGKVAAHGSSSDVAAEYQNLFLKEDRQKLEAQQADILKQEGVEQAGKAKINEVIIFQNGSKEPTQDIEAFENFTIKLKVETMSTYKDINVVLNIKNSKGDVVFAAGTRQYVSEKEIKAGVEQEFSFNIENIFTNGNYTVNVGVNDFTTGNNKLLHRENIATTFTIFGVKHHQGSLVHPKVKVKRLG